MKKCLKTVLLVLCLALLTACSKNTNSSGNSGRTTSETTPDPANKPEAEPTEQISGTPAPTEPAEPTETPVPTANPIDDMYIKDLYKDEFMVGMALPNSVFGKSFLTETVKNNFSSMTFENEMKPDYTMNQNENIEGFPATETSPIISMTGIKRGMDFAKENGIKVRMHTLIWHSQTPDWFFTTDYKSDSPLASRDVMIKRMEGYIRNVMKYLEENYPGMVYCYDVVNEAIDPGQGEKNGLRKESKWYEIIGPDFISYAFEFARKYAPEGVKLYYNDYNCAQKCNLIIKTLTPILEAGNIDGIGMQCHLSTSDKISSKVYRTAKSFSDAGFQVQITELDIGITGGEYAELVQAMKYRVLFETMQKAKRDGEINIDCITIWGLYDSISWRKTEFPLIYRQKGTELEKKLAWYGIMQDPSVKGVEW